MSDTLYQLFNDIRDLKDDVALMQEQMKDTTKLDKLGTRIEDISHSLGCTASTLESVIVRQYHKISIKPGLVLSQADYDKHLKAANKYVEKS